MDYARLIFTPTRSAGLARLNSFLPNAGRHYESRRNHDLGPAERTNVSMLSPYISHRLITEEEVLGAVLAKHSPAAAEKFVQEVFWRTYFKGHLETRPFLWTSYKAALQTQVDDLGGKGGLRKSYERATDGRTGLACFDAWVEELVETGYLHNHTRMWFASIWIFTLQLPWQLGADFMYRHLLDGDAASNTLSWRWVGGLHTKGKTYLARADNIRSCTGGRFDPQGLAREAPPLEEGPMLPATKLRAAASGYPTGRIGLLLSEDDLHPVLPDSAVTQIVAVAGGTCTDERSPLPVSNLVTTFAAAALVDGLANTAARLNVSATSLPTFSSVCVLDWARAIGVTTVAVPYAPLGPAADELLQLKSRLTADGITLVEVRRDFDARTWPYGTRGFFAMKEKIPTLLGSLEPFAEGGAQQSLFAAR